MEITFRLMNPQDIDEVYRINKESFTTDAWSRESIEREFTLPYSHKYVAETGGKVIAYAFLWLIEGEAFIMSLAVDKRYRNLGIGKKLLGHIHKEVEGRAKVVQLDVRKSNLPAIRLYRSMGYRVVRERPKFYSDGETAFVMELDLTGYNTSHG